MTNVQLQIFICLVVRDIVSALVFTYLGTYGVFWFGYFHRRRFGYVNNDLETKIIGDTSRFQHEARLLNNDLSETQNDKMDEEKKI